MSHSPTELLSELIAIPSVNPMGRDVSGEIYLEHRLTDWLEGYFQSHGLSCVRQPVEPGRENIVARLDGSVPPEQGGPVVLWEVHQDTVPVDAMTIPPFEPTIREGRVYGRGACDVKGGMASMLAALAHLAQSRRSNHQSRPANHKTSNRPTIVLACAVNEEFGFSGAKALAASWSDAEQSDDRGSCHEANAAVRSLLGRRPDMAIVAEPTDLNVVVAHKGGVRWFLHVLGHAAHSSKPHLGDNAIYRAARAALAIERYQDEVLSTLDEHRWCGRPTLSATTVHGGISSNTIPDRVTLEIERRNVPGEDPLAARQAVIDYLNESLPKDAPQFDHASPSIVVNALSDSHNGSLSERLLQATQTICPQAQRIGVDYGADASVIAPGGVPTVVFGPGSIDQAHTADEWVAIEQLDRAAEILVRFVEGFSY